MRAHLAVLFCCRPRDSLEYKFRCTVCQPPYYLPHVASAYQTPPSGELPPSEKAPSGPLVVPTCFLPQGGTPKGKAVVVPE